MKNWLIAAAILSLLGILLFAGLMTSLKWDFSLLSSSQPQVSTYPLDQPFSSISIDTDTADIIFTVADDGAGKVTCQETETDRYSVALREDTLVIESDCQGKKWYEHISPFSHPMTVTVSLPQTQYNALFIRESTGDIRIPQELSFGTVDIAVSTGDITCYASAASELRLQTSTGQIFLENVSAENISLTATTGNITVTNTVSRNHISMQLSTGKTKLTGLSCKSFHSTASTGDIVLKQVTAEEKLSVERSTGDITLTGCDAGELFLQTDTGDISGTLLTPKIVYASSDTGKIRVPKSTTGGSCEITTDTGDIEIQIIG